VNPKYTLKHGLYVLAFLIVFGFLLFVSLYNPKLELGQYNSDHLPDFSFEDVEISQLVDGKLKWQLHSEYAEIMKKDNYAKLNDADGKIFDKGEEVIKFKSKYATVSLEDSTMDLDRANAQFFMNGDVVDLSANTLTWDPKTKQFVGHDNIKLKSKLATLYGDYFYVNVPFKILKVNTNSRAEVYTPDVKNN
jgi:LPS export ABC transporter protein LptC